MGSAFEGSKEPGEKDGVILCSAVLWEHIASEPVDISSACHFHEICGGSDLTNKRGMYFNKGGYPCKL